MNENNKDKPITIEFTGERFLPNNPDAAGEIEVEHYHRYLMARKFAQGKKVLDVACGEGYGSYLLSEVASSVTGVDISEETIEHATNSYQRTGLTYLQGNAAKIPVADGSIDLVVSFETIEHHDRHEEMMLEISRVLQQDGLLIISSPDKKEYSDIPNYDNPYHVKELYLSEFETLLRKHFSNIALLGQRIKFGSIIAPLNKNESIFESFKKSDASYSDCKGIFSPMYFIAMVSNGILPSLPSGIYEEKIENANYVIGVKNIYEKSYKKMHGKNQEYLEVIEEKNKQISNLNRIVDEEFSELINEKNEIISNLERTIIEYNKEIVTHNLVFKKYKISWFYRLIKLVKKYCV